MEARRRDGFLGRRGSLETMARCGHAAKGFVYLVIGVMASSILVGARSWRGRPDPTGALVEMTQQPFGSVLLGLTAIGLVCYALWRLFEGVKNPDQVGKARQAGRLMSGLIHVGLAGVAFELLLTGIRPGSGAEKEWTATVMGWPLGTWLVGAVGAGLIVAGLVQSHRAWSLGFLREFRHEELSARMRKLLERVGRLGLGSRGVVFALIGWFLIRAAVHFDPSEAGGMAQAFGELLQQPYGPVWLGVVSIGLMAYGVHAFLRARHGRFVTR